MLPENNELPDVFTRHTQIKNRCAPRKHHLAVGSAGWLKSHFFSESELSALRAETKVPSPKSPTLYIKNFVLRKSSTCCFHGSLKVSPYVFTAFGRRGVGYDLVVPRDGACARHADRPLFRRDGRHRRLLCGVSDSESFAAPFCRRRVFAGLSADAVRSEGKRKS